MAIWWQKDGENLTRVEDKYSMEVEVLEGLVTSQLVVSSIDWGDAGVYLCRARDGEEGRIEKNKATLSVQGGFSSKYLYLVACSSEDALIVSLNILTFLPTAFTLGVKSGTKTIIISYNTGRKYVIFAVTGGLNGAQNIK